MVALGRMLSVSSCATGQPGTGHFPIFAAASTEIFQVLFTLTIIVIPNRHSNRQRLLDSRWASVVDCLCATRGIWYTPESVRKGTAVVAPQRRDSRGNLPQGVVMTR